MGWGWGQGLCIHLNNANFSHKQVSNFFAIYITETVLEILHFLFAQINCKSALKVQSIIERNEIKVGGYVRTALYNRRVSHLPCRIFQMPDLECKNTDCFIWRPKNGEPLPIKLSE